MTLAIRAARPGEEASLTDLAVRSKGHWGHDAAFLARARTGLTLRPEHLDRWIVRVAERDGEVAGVAAVDPEAAELELLFVEPAAEPFYRAHGAEPIGTRVSSATGRELPLLRITT